MRLIKSFEKRPNTEQYQGILGFTDEPLVSSDIVQDPRASIVDLTMTQVVDGDLVKVMAWYDNEWGYANQMNSGNSASWRNATSHGLGMVIS